MYGCGLLPVKSPYSVQTSMEPNPTMDRPLSRYAHIFPRPYFTRCGTSSRRMRTTKSSGKLQRQIARNIAWSTPSSVGERVIGGGSAILVLHNERVFRV